MNLLFNAATIPSALMFAALNEQDLLGDLIGSAGAVADGSEALHLLALQRRADA